MIALAVLAGCSTPGKPQPGPSPSAAAPQPSFADVSRGDTDSVVRLRAYDPAARSAVVEPTVFMQGPDFCTAFRLPEDDPRCDQEWTTEDSHTKVTLPVEEDVRLLSHGAGDPACIGQGTGAGTCPVTPETFGMMLRRDGGDLLVKLRTEDGRVVEMAELYTP
ncbi:hypothetical protein AB0J80_20580 [Actinoplanes sp. NPDC049548]|uniref:hypothetical protein n=1 Tax=Actinoplanes sp. NPDC049548 TaxID=3155152 RepID=UPI0034358B1B